MKTYQFTGWSAVSDYQQYKIQNENREFCLFKLRFNLEFQNNLTTIGSLHLLWGWRVEQHEVKLCVCLLMTCNISHFLIFCAYLGHKPLGVMFQDKSVCERLCHSNVSTWIECHRKNYVSWSITFTCTLLIACCIHASKLIGKLTEHLIQNLCWAKLIYRFFWEWWSIGCERYDNLKNYFRWIKIYSN